MKKTLFFILGFFTFFQTMVHAQGSLDGKFVVDASLGLNFSNSKSNVTSTGFGGTTDRENVLNNTLFQLNAGGGYAFGGNFVAGVSFSLSTSNQKSERTTNGNITETTIKATAFNPNLFIAKYFSLGEKVYVTPTLSFGIINNNLKVEEPDFGSQFESTTKINYFTTALSLDFMYMLNDKLAFKVRPFDLAYATSTSYEETPVSTTETDQKYSLFNVNAQTNPLNWQYGVTFFFGGTGAE